MTYVNYTFEDFLGRIRTSFAGRVAEVEFFGKEEINDGASSDFRHATYFAKIMTMKLGMGNRIIIETIADEVCNSTYKYLTGNEIKEICSRFEITRI